MSFQSESKKSGDEFEDAVLEDIKRRSFISVEKNVYMPGTGCEVDFIAYGQTVEHIESKGGREDIGKRPGAQRTDNVKKAVANGALIKAKYPEIYYVVYFSAEPLPNSSSSEMIETALSYKIIDEVRYISNKVKDSSQLQLDIWTSQMSFEE